ncbi:MAG: response regulator [bacterium]|nr:response regulator [bacterium]
MEKKKILIIDDDPAFLKITRDEFDEQGGFEVITAMNGDDGKKRAEEEKPDLIVLDIILPSRSGEMENREEGIRVLDDLKANPETKDIKIIIVTCRIDYMEVKRKAESMEIPFFRKPLDTIELVEKAKNMLGV